MATNAVYNLYSGNPSLGDNGWVEYHLRTNAGQVQMTTGDGWRKFVSAKVKVNGKAFAEGSETGSAEVTITGDDINNGVASGTYNYITSGAKLNATLVTLDSKIKEAKDAIPSGVLTTANYANTLGDVYQAKDADLTAIADLTGNSGFLKKTGANTWALDTTSYVPTSRTVNGKQLNNNIVLKASDIGWNNAVGFSSTNVEDEIQNLWGAANGITRGYGIDTDTTGTNVVNSQFASNAGERSFSISDSTSGGVSTKKIRLLGGFEEVLLSSLKVGDNIFLDDERMPDWWVSGVNNNLMNNTITVTFSILETQVVNLSNYVTKGTTLAHYGITDAKIENGVITLGSNTIKPLTSHQDISGKAPNNHASTATTYGVGTTTKYGHVKLATGDMNGASNEDGVACSKNHTHSQYLTSHQSLAEYPKIYVQSSAPTGGTYKKGDIWIKE